MTEHHLPDDVLETTPEVREEEPLDAYSRVVSSVAATLLPSVASLRVGRPGRRGAREAPEGGRASGAFIRRGLPAGEGCFYLPIHAGNLSCSAWMSRVADSLLVAR